VPEGVDDERVPVAVELVDRLPLEGRAQLDGAGDGGVDVLDVDELEHRRPGQPTGRRRGRAHVRGRVLDDQYRVADLDLRVRDRAVRAGKPHPLGRAEHLAVEVDGLGRTVHDEARGDPAVVVRNRVWLRLF
jgi:hypothetical protein